MICLSTNHFYTIDLEAGVKYQFEVISDTTQCALDPAAYLYEGECTVAGDPITITGCTEIAYNDEIVDTCGPYKDPYFEYTSATTGPYTFRVRNWEGYSLNCTEADIIDGYKYSAKVTALSSFTGCPAGQREVVVTIDTDDYYNETSWDIDITGTSTAVASGGDDDDGLPYDGVHTWYNCLPDGDYTFTIYDSYGDGMCSHGSYKLSVDGVQKFNVNGIDFGTSDSRDFSTVPLVKCENTFVLSESGLECICPDGFDFHANVNRCLPPPTAAPTSLPTKSPTLAPTASPTQTPTFAKTCADDESATFSLVNREKDVDCAWLTKNSKKEKVRKANYCGLNHVKLHCKVSCAFCDCEDDPDFTFELMNVKDDNGNPKIKDCSWLLTNSNAKEDRIANYCTDDFEKGSVLNVCTKSCGQCLNDE